MTSEQRTNGRLVRGCVVAAIEHLGWHWSQLPLDERQVLEADMEAAYQTARAAGRWKTGDPPDEIAAVYQEMTA